MNGMHSEHNRGRLSQASCSSNIPSNNKENALAIALGDESSAGIIARKNLCSYYLQSTAVWNSLSNDEHGQAAVL